MINANTTLRTWEPATLPLPPATQAETQADLIVENANLRQENTELHETIGALRAEIDQLKKRNRRLNLHLMQAQGAASLLIAALSIDTEPVVY